MDYYSNNDTINFEFKEFVNNRNNKSLNVKENNYEYRSAPCIFYWDLFRNKIIKNKNKSENIFLGVEKECRCFLNMNEIKIGMKYNQSEHTIKLYRNDIELGIVIQKINPGLYPAIEIHMEECKIKLSLNSSIICSYLILCFSANIF